MDVRWGKRCVHGGRKLVLVFLILFLFNIQTTWKYQWRVYYYYLFFATYPSTNSIFSLNLTSNIVFYLLLIR